MSRLHQLHDRYGQSPWLDNRTRGDVTGGRLRRLASQGIRGVTLLFGLDRYDQIIEAYLSGLEAHDGDLARVHGVASFFVSRVDSEVDRRLETIGTPEALELRGKAALAQAKLAYQLFRNRFSGPRWQALAARGARVQRPLWASTSTKNPAYPDTLYVDSLIGPDTVTTLPEATIAVFGDRGTLADTLTHGAEDAKAAGRGRRRPAPGRPGAGGRRGGRVRQELRRAAVTAPGQSGRGRSPPRRPVTSPRRPTRPAAAGRGRGRR
jgi:hypothetical protein